MKGPLLKDAAVYPSDAVLAEVLSSTFETYQGFVAQLPQNQIALEWRYYKDGKSWLAKGTAGKKTVFWLSVWEGFFCISFFFTERSRQGVQELPIAQELKTRLQQAPVKGRLAALVVEARAPQQLADLFRLIAYKRACQ